MLCVAAFRAQNSIGVSKLPHLTQGIFDDSDPLERIHLANLFEREDGRSSNGSNE